MTVIMNPPFTRGIYIKILNKSVEVSDEVICLAPNDISFNFGKYVLYNDFCDLRALYQHLISEENLEEIAWKKFNLQLKMYHTPLAISHFSNKIISKRKDFWGNDDFFLKLAKDFKKNNLRRNFKPVAERGKYFQKVFLIHPYDRADSSSAILCKEEGRATAGINFDTAEELKNFQDSIKCWPYRLMVTHFNDMRPEHLPFTGDYKEPWTDERFYKYFNLTEDEITLIKGNT